MAAQELRDYQRRGAEEIKAAWASGAESVLAVSPTGSGKTTLFTHLIFSEPNERALIVVHRRELADQAANRLREFGVNFGFIMSGEPSKPSARVQIATVQTLVRRRLLPHAGIVICDEAHLSTADTWTKVLEHYPHARKLGVTATPWRLGGKPLAGTYDATIVIASPSELRKQGHLCDYLGFAYKSPDLSKVKTTGGDFNEKQTAEVMREPTLVANVVQQWKAHASHLSTVVFAVTVEHSQQLTAEFRAAGVRAEHLDGATSLEAREAILRRVDRGETQVLCNVGVAVEGLDIPRLKCCVLARPTQSLARAIQMMGRVRRPWGGQVARIHDHAFNIGRHGLPDQERDYTLTAKPEKPPSLSTCPTCLATFPPNGSCPSCGVEIPTERGERGIVEIDDAELMEFSSELDVAAGLAKPRVAVQWTTPGRVIEGVYEEKRQEKTAWGIQNRYFFRSEKRHYDLPGTADLDRRMAKVAIGAKVRVEYKGRPDGKRHEFSVHVDDGEEPRPGYFQRAPQFAEAPAP